MLRPSALAADAPGCSSCEPAPATATTQRGVRDALRARTVRAAAGARQAREELRSIGLATPPPRPATRMPQGDSCMPPHDTGSGGVGVLAVRCGVRPCVRVVRRTTWSLVRPKNAPSSLGASGKKSASTHELARSATNEWASNRDTGAWDPRVCGKQETGSAHAPAAQATPRCPKVRSQICQGWRIHAACTASESAVGS